MHAAIVGSLSRELRVSGRRHGAMLANASYSARSACLELPRAVGVDSASSAAFAPSRLTSARTSPWFTRPGLEQRAKNVGEPTMRTRISSHVARTHRCFVFTRAASCCV